MALSGYKVVLFFQNQGNGWSETYFNNATDKVTMQSRVDALVAIRQTLLAHPAQLIAYRLSLEVNPRSSNLTKVAPITSYPYSFDADQVAMTCLLRLYSSGQNRSRAVYLRGVPDQAFNLSSPFNADAVLFRTNFLILGNFLRNGLWGWTIKYGPRLGEAATVDITDWAPTVPSTNSVVTGTGIQTAVGDAQSVLIYNIRGLPFSPGRTRHVAMAGLSSQEVAVRYRTPVDFVYQGGGKIMPYVPNYDIIDNFSQNPAFIKRATGRPSGISRGRRRSIPR